MNLRFVFVTLTIVQFLACAVGEAPAFVEGEGEGEGTLCATSPDVVACDPIFNDTECPFVFASATTPCTVHNLVCTWCNINGGGFSVTLWCDEAGEPPTWLQPASCFEEK